MVIGDTFIYKLKVTDKHYGQECTVLETTDEGYLCECNGVTFFLTKMAFRANQRKVLDMDARNAYLRKS